MVALAETTLRDAPGLIGNETWGLYNPTCCAALLAADAKTKLAESERTRIRALAREWLEREAKAWRTWVTDGGELAAEGRTRLKHTRQDVDLVSLRGEALQSLPEDERKAWQELWARIEQTAKENDR